MRSKSRHRVEQAQAEHSQPSYVPPNGNPADVDALVADSGGPPSAIRMQASSIEAEYEVESAWMPGSTLREYDEINPRFAEMVIQEHLEEAKHRRALETSNHGRASSFMLRGQWMTYTLGMASIAAAIVLGMAGSAAGSALLGSFPLATILVTVISRIMQRTHPGSAASGKKQTDTGMGRQALSQGPD